MAEFMRIEVLETFGSAPREAGASMIVSATSQTGTIGGGRLEYDAIAQARACLSDGIFETQQTVALGPEIGQCCGGKVILGFARSEKPSQNPATTPAFVFGGGHVGRAIARALVPLPFSVELVETRASYLRDLSDTITATELAAPEAAVRSAPPGAVFIVTTHDHALDFLIVEDAIRRRDAAYIGMIGSKSKRAVLTARLREADLDATELTCPIGVAGLGDKRPEVIAAFTATEILMRLRKT